MHTQLMTADALMTRWRVSRRTLRRLVAEGVVVQRRFGGRVGFRWQDVWASEGAVPRTGEEARHMEPLLSAAEVARLCPYAESTLKAYARAGRIPSRRVGGGRMFAPVEVAAWLDGWETRGGSKNANGGQIDS